MKKILFLLLAILPLNVSWATETITYKYDAKGRLIEVKRTGTVNNNVTATYTYDKANNRKSVIVTGSPNTSPPPP
jgi:hypothetical protein